ncbi:hypothetical protein PG993_008437 [Apiospora rasikravindrae]|uniref:Uncharacterized protein n=1 Tax=Apiospora rasikravindrae TaxID=990691 RepID=A0ABR1T1S7_9PEZI
MSRHNPSVSDESRKARSRTSSQTSYSVHMSSYSPQASHINISTKRSSVHSHTKAPQPSPLKMVTTSSTAHQHHHHPRDDVSYYFLPSEADLACQGWMTPTVIDDDDLMFGGKSLSEWYEEERMQAASPRKRSDVAAKGYGNTTHIRTSITARKHNHPNRQRSRRATNFTDDTWNSTLFY